ncbi:DUF4293 domain-containing protein [Candidatus Cardinium hertigii]|uniref:DUF4293 family protein n=1 Tax=Candidatus Cardinium hertigii TaxID=247481 RepID=A0A3N2QAX1_9BACT|nr:DUF4293 domain-containing protein [Candidatus Cardinium hertigii]ROT46900.1 DUF4293 family protein [Candidatus Cardinium hertigii]
MIQRIQSLYLAVVSIFMVIFLCVSVWIKMSLHNACSFLLTPYALVGSSGQYITMPYGLTCLLACLSILSAAYAIVRHDNRKLQLRLTFGINVILILLLVWVFWLIRKADSTYLLVDGISSYKAGIVLPFMALLANVLARHHIKNDERLVNEDNLR